MLKTMGEAAAECVVHCSRRIRPTSCPAREAKPRTRCPHYSTSMATPAVRPPHLQQAQSQTQSSHLHCTPVWIVTHTVSDPDLSFRLPNIKHLVATVGANVLIVSYRGCVLAAMNGASCQVVLSMYGVCDLPCSRRYGKSEGTPSEEGLRLDAEVHTFNPHRVGGTAAVSYLSVVGLRPGGVGLPVL